MLRSEFLNHKNLSGFCKTCLENDYHGGVVFRELWDKAVDLDDFIELVWNDPRVFLGQGTSELFKNDPGNNERYLNRLMSDQRFETYSDAGSVRVGNETFTFNISNGIGDGITFVDVRERNININFSLNFITVVKGTFNIYTDDCVGDEIAKTLTGTFGVYSRDGYVIFERWE
jgi:hypothetical protein